MSIFIPDDPNADIEASQLHEFLWQGSFPSFGPKLSEAGFKLLVLCAMENQPPSRKYPGVEVLHAPNNDNFYMPPTREQLEIAWHAAGKVVEYMARGEAVLVTCMQGVNRSSLVSAMALHKHLGCSGVDACVMIRAARPGTLTNPQFVKCLARLQGKAPEATGRLLF